MTGTCNMSTTFLDTRCASSISEQNQIGQGSDIYTGGKKVAMDKKTIYVVMAGYIGHEFPLVAYMDEKKAGDRSEKELGYVTSIYLEE